jgi:hypothetical protein
MSWWRSGWLAVALAIAAAGCGGDGDKKTAQEQATPAAGAPAEGTATPAPSATPEEAAALVETLGSVDGGRARFILTELRRSGPTVILNARLEPVDPAGTRLQVGSTFDDGSFQALEDGGDEGGDVFDGVALVDPEGRKKYLVARDETNRCVCSNELSSAFIRAEAPVELTATLAAPPPGVTQVDLIVPRFETLRGVPLAE